MKLPNLQKSLWLLFPLLVCFLGLMMTTLGIIGLDLKFIPGDLGDARFNLYIFEHGHQFFFGDTAQFWNAPFMFPFEHVVALSDNLLGSLPIYSAFRIAGADRETAYQFWFITICILNFYCAFFVLKRLTKNVVLACSGAFLFAFPVLLFSQFNHAQVFPRFIVPLVIYWIIVYFRQSQFKFLLLACLGVVFQFYCTMYLGFFLGLICIVFFGVNCLQNVRAWKLPNIKREGLKLAACAVISILLLLPLYLPYKAAAAIMGTRTWEDVKGGIPNIESYFFTSAESVTWQCLNAHSKSSFSAYWDHQIFIGFIPFAALAIGLFLLLKKQFRQSEKNLTAVIITLIIVLLLTTAFGSFTFYRAVYAIPGFDSIRALQRIVNVEIMLFAIIVCLILNASITKHRNLIFISVLILVAIEQLGNPKKASRLDKELVQSRIEPIVEAINKSDKKNYVAFAYLPKVDEAPYVVQLDAMMASQIVSMPCINGYSATSPAEFTPFWMHYNENGLKQWLMFNHITEDQILIIH